MSIQTARSAEIVGPSSSQTEAKWEIDWGRRIARICALLFALALLGAVVILASQWFVSTPRITGANAISSLEPVELNGSTQWLSIRGKDINNPVLLFLAGGPGGSELAMTRKYLGGLEDHFVIVNWDQPGAGKSYNAVPIGHLTPQRYVEDGLALTQYLRVRFQQEKIYLLGESWGSILGVWLAQQRPEWYHALVTSGQMVNTTENDRIGYDLAIEYLEKSNRKGEADRLRRNGAPPYIGVGMARRYMAYMNVQNESMASNAGGEGVEHNLLLDSMRAPEYSLLDKVNWLRGLAGVYAQVYPQLALLNLVEQAPGLDLPVYFIKGRWDVNAVNELTQFYFDRLEAPRKELIWFEDAAHTPLWDEPNHFVDVMVNTVLAQTSPLQTSETGYAGYFDGEIPRYLREFGIPGAVVSVIEENKPVLVKGYGYADLTTHRPMDAQESLVHIGSVGKICTAIAVLQLAEEGLVDLDADIAAYLDFEIPATFPEPITLRHLLSHTSGFGARDGEAIVHDPATVPTIREYLVRNLPPRRRSPGVAIGYSNYGMALAGYIVERIAGESLTAYLHGHVLGPLAMTGSDASLIPSPHGEVALASGHASGQPAPQEYVGAFGAAPIRSTAADMARFMHALLNPEALAILHVLQPESANAMQTRQVAADPRQNVTGLGLYQLSRGGVAIWGHLGSTGYFHSLMLLIPEHRLGVFVSFNAAEGSQVLRTERFIDDFVDRFFPVETHSLAPPADFATHAQEYAGRYFFNTMHADTLIGDLLNLTEMVSIQPTQDDRLRLAHKGIGRTFTEVEPDLFLRSDGEDLLAFHRDANRVIQSVSLNSRPVFTLERGSWWSRPLRTGVVTVAVVLAASVGLLVVAVRGCTKLRGSRQTSIPSDKCTGPFLSKSA